MRSIQKNQYRPVFTPRFHLSDGQMVGIEVQIKSGQKVLPALETFRLILSGKNRDLLNEINAHLSKWCEKAEKNLYLSWELSSETNPVDLNLFLDELSLALPLQQLEIVLDADDLKGSETLNKVIRLFGFLPDKHIRRGLFHSHPLEFTADEICGHIDLFKLKRGVIMEMKDDIIIASKGYSFIESLNIEKIDIVADELYSKADVTSAIMMGIQYGQGYFLSRNQAPQKIVKPLKKRPNNDFYERRFDCFESLGWS